MSVPSLMETLPLPTTRSKRQRSPSPEPTPVTKAPLPTIKVSKKGHGWNIVSKVSWIVLFQFFIVYLTFYFSSLTLLTFPAHLMPLILVLLSENQRDWENDFQILVLFHSFYSMTMTIIMTIHNNILILEPGLTAKLEVFKHFSLTVTLWSTLFNIVWIISQCQRMIVITDLSYH